MTRLGDETTMVSKLQMRQHIDDLTSPSHRRWARREIEGRLCHSRTDGAIESALPEALRLAAAISAHICDSGKVNAPPAAMLRQLRQIGPTQVTLDKPAANQVAQIQVSHARSQGHIHELSRPDGSRADQPR